MTEERTPVIVGVGQVEDRLKTDRRPLSALDLMVQSVLAAAADAGGHGLDSVDRIAVVDALSWENRPAPIHPDLIERLRLTPRRAETSPSPSGNYPVRFLNDAANAIAAGECEVALVVGGEAMRSMGRRKADGGGQPASGTEIIRAYRGGGEEDLPQRYDLLTPMDVYPFYEQATRHAWGQSQSEATGETGAIWAENARVAAENPHAWIRGGWDVRRITEVAADNPMLTFPYTRAMVANSGVNQGAAVLLTSAGAARRAGIDERRLVTVGYGAAADEATHNLERETFSRSPAMQASLTRTLRLNGLETEDLDLVELYSCFPCVPKMARRILRWPMERPHSVYGGLTFGGGPIGNCMTHAIAAMVEKLRAGARAGLIFANGGFATRNHGIVLRRGVQTARDALSYDVQAEADRLRGPTPPLVSDYRGAAMLETFAAPFAAGRPRYANVLALTPTGTRCLCRVPADDEGTLGWLTSGAEPVGSPGQVVSGPGGLAHWRRRH